MVEPTTFNRVRVDKDFEAESVDTEDVFNSSIGDNVDYADPLWLGKSDARHWNWIPDALDGVFTSTSGSGSVGSLFDGSLDLETGTTDESHARAVKDVEGLVRTWDKDMVLDFVLDFKDTTPELYAVHGAVNEDNLSQVHIGFAMLNGDLVGTVADGSAESTGVMVSGASTGTYRLRAVLTAGTDVQFEVIDGPQTGTATVSANLPTGANGPPQRILTALAENDTATNRRMQVERVAGVQSP